MRIAANILVAGIALLHVWIFVLESFLWQKSRGRKAFKLTAQRAEITAPLAKNQGAHNAFLAAGLFWSLFAAEPMAFQLKLFFLGCVAVAGLVGGKTVSRRIYLVQALPAALAMLLVCLA